MGSCVFILSSAHLYAKCCFCRFAIELPTYSLRCNATETHVEIRCWLSGLLALRGPVQSTRSSCVLSESAPEMEPTALSVCPVVLVGRLGRVGLLGPSSERAMEEASGLAYGEEIRQQVDPIHGLAKSSARHSHSWQELVLVTSRRSDFLAAPSPFPVKSTQSGGFPTLTAARC